MFSESEELVQQVWFFREDFCYPVWGRIDEDWMKHVFENPETIKVIDSNGNQIWPVEKPH